MFEKITGFFPTATAVVSNGTSREDWKTRCFQKGKGLKSDAILKPKDLAVLLVPEAKGRILGPISRQELLRQTFRDINIRQALTELRKARFRPRYLEALDRALQSGRMKFAHSAELEVAQQVLNEKNGFVEKRNEYFALHRFWERLLELRELWDEARLFSEAAERVDTWSPPVALQEIYWIAHESESARVSYFLEALKRKVQVHVVPPTQENNSSIPKTLLRKRWHSLEDAALGLLDRFQSDSDLDDLWIVIEDDPLIRRTLRRVAESRGLFLQDARDPMSNVVDESIKVSTLEFELVARGFKWEQVLEWIRFSKHSWTDREGIRKAVLEEGLTSARKKWPELEQKVNELTARFPLRPNFEELKAGVLQGNGHHSLLEKVFDHWKLALQPVGALGQRWPLRIWLDQFLERVTKAPPSVDPYRTRRGLRLFRVDQARPPVLNPATATVVFFGLSPKFLEPLATSEDWLTAQDLECLSQEFQIPHREQLQEQNHRSFLGWYEPCRQAESFEWSYDHAGTEVETLDWGYAQVTGLETSLEEMSAHPRHLRSLQAQREPKSAECQLEWMRSDSTWPISLMQTYGVCPFTAFAAYGLKLKDEEDPDYDLKSSERGSLVHAAVEVWLGAQMADARVSPEEAFRQAWKKQRKTGLLKSHRLEKNFREQTIQILKQFVASEAEFQDFSKSKPFRLEVPVQWNVGNFQFQGRIDRVDTHPEGWIVFDYKTASKVPNGEDALRGLGLQLPAYGLAWKATSPENAAQPLVGAGYIQLTSREVIRNQGVFFQKFNRRKKADQVEFPVSRLTGNSRSLFQEEPEQIWDRFESLLQEKAQAMGQGLFSATPTDPQDCTSCRFSAVCGVKRRGKLVAND